MADTAETTGAALELPRAHAVARFVRMSPMKCRRMVDLVRGVPVSEALAILRFSPQAAAEPVAKVVASAAANAENNLDLDPDTLVVAVAMVDEGPTLKRIRPRAQGRAYRIRKRTSHITIEVESRPAASAGGGRRRGAPGDGSRRRGASTGRAR